MPNAGYYELWEFQIQAVNSKGKGPVSPIKQSRSGQDAPKDKPTNLKKGDVTARSIDLTWKKVTVERGSVDGYRVRDRNTVMLFFEVSSLQDIRR